MKLVVGSFWIAIVGLMSILTPARAQLDATYIRTEFGTATKSIFEGSVRDGIGRLSTLLGKIDPQADPSDYWIIIDTLADILHQVSYPEGKPSPRKLHSTNIVNQNSLPKDASST
jgi:hypothetical protein